MSTNTLTQLPLPKKIKSPKDLPLIENFILSGITATIAKTIAAPIERVKILLQTQFILNDLNKKYKGNIDCLQRIYTEQGFTAFWRGNMANLIRYVPNFALSYSFKEYFKKYIEKNHFSNSDSPITKKQKYFINILSASLAGASSIILTYPLDLTRTVMAADVKSNKNKLYNGFIDCLVKCYNKGGVMGLYAGLIPNIYANFVYRGLLFGLHDSKVNSTSFSMNFLITFINSSFAITIALPFDTIKRRLMVQTTKDVKDYKGVIDCFRKIYINEGYKGYMRGATANIIKSLGTALTLILNDKLFEYYISNYKI